MQRQYFGKQPPCSLSMRQIYKPAGSHCVVLKQVTVMHAVPIVFRIMTGVALTLVLILPGVAGADVDMEAYLGDTIPLHGYSYLGDTVYLFLTGPDLPENGVTLTDTSLRADRGYFTIVDVDENQAFTYLWKTSRIESQIDEGTYTVYITNQPVDRSRLGSDKSYKTISVFLRDPGVSKMSITAEHAYTRSQGVSVTTPLPAAPVIITSQTPEAPQPAVTTVPTREAQTTTPTARAGTGPFTAVTALFCCLILVFILKPRL